MSLGADLTISSLVKRYAETTAVSGVSLDVAAGEFVTLLGASGSGKTTTLMIVAGFIEPDSGSVRIGGRTVDRMPPEKRNLGVVFQSYALFPNMNVRENVGFPLRMRRVERNEIENRVGKALDMVGLGGYSARRIDQLSGGQQQRVALARALIFEPPLLLMDEPLGALDRKLREQMQGEIKNLQRSLGLTVLYVTHDQEEAMVMSDRIAIMSNGGIAQVGPPAEIYDHPVSAFVADFLGESNLWPVRILGVDGTNAALAPQTAEAPVVAAALRGPVPQGPARLMLRPENIAILETAGGAENEIAGTVERTDFVGSTVRLIVKTPFGNACVRATRKPGWELPAVGSAIRLGWATSSAAVFGNTHAPETAT